MIEQRTPRPEHDLHVSLVQKGLCAGAGPALWGNASRGVSRLLGLLLASQGRGTQRRPSYQGRDGHHHHFSTEGQPSITQGPCGDLHTSPLSSAPPFPRWGSTETKQLAQAHSPESSSPEPGWGTRGPEALAHTPALTQLWSASHKPRHCPRCPSNILQQRSLASRPCHRNCGCGSALEAATHTCEPMPPAEGHSLLFSSKPLS